MHVRKLVKAGPSSHTVSLPKEWLDQHKLTKGSTIYLQPRDHALVILPDLTTATSTVREKTLDVDKKTIETIGRELTSAYVNNYTMLRFTGDTLHEKAKEIRRLLRDFAALEIVEQTPTLLVAQDMLNLKEVSVEKTIRRMDMTVRSMFKDGISSLDNPALTESVVLRDYDMNRMYFLLYRLLKGSLKDPIMAQQVQLTNDKVLGSWLTANTLENLGDTIKNAAKLCGKLSKQHQTQVRETYAALELLYLDAIKAQFTTDRTLAESVARKREGLAGKAGKLAELGLLDVAETFKTMGTLITDLARGVIDSDS